MNFGLSLEELRSGKPIIGIAQTGNDLSPCNRHYLVLAERPRERIPEAEGSHSISPIWRWSRCSTGAMLEGAEKYQRIAQTMSLPRDNR